MKSCVPRTTSRDPIPRPGRPMFLVAMCSSKTTHGVIFEVTLDYTTDATSIHNILAYVSNCSNCLLGSLYFPFPYWGVWFEGLPYPTMGRSIMGSSLKFSLWELRWWWTNSFHFSNQTSGLGSELGSDGLFTVQFLKPNTLYVVLEQLEMCVAVLSCGELWRLLTMCVQQRRAGGERSVI